LPRRAAFHLDHRPPPRCAWRADARPAPDRRAEPVRSCRQLESDYAREALTRWYHLLTRAS
jgi:hypothetical protein